jgi:hypothetical protein
MLKNKLLVFSPGLGGEFNSGKLIASCQKYGYELDFYAKDQGFHNFRQIKMDYILEFLRTVEHEYVMFTDAWDSWLLTADILKVYKKHFDNKIVISGNRDHYPQTDLYDMVKDVGEFPTDTSFRFVCSAQFMGPTKKLIELFEKMDQEYKGYTDQEGWHVLKVKKLFDYEIDSQCRLFLNMTNVEESELDEHFVLGETGIRPCSIHFGGPKGDHPNAIAMARFFDKWLSEA